MRRMLDPKTIGEGNQTPERHAYRVVVNDSFHYLVYTTKNYGWPIGKMITLGNFGNDEYAELRAVGYYSAGGVYKSDTSAIIVNTFRIIGPYQYSVYGYNLETKESTQVSTKITSRQVCQFF